MEGPRWAKRKATGWEEEQIQNGDDVDDSGRGQAVGGERCDSERWRGLVRWTSWVASRAGGQAGEPRACPSPLRSSTSSA